MDPSAYLIRQGWLGSGHSLNPKGHGITKPVLVSQKTDVLGLGKRKHDAHADQWWARAFDATLKQLNVSQDTGTGMTEVTLRSSSQPLRGEIHGGTTRYFATSLYGHFVQGEGLKGTQIPQGVEQVQRNSCQDLQDVERGAKAARKEERRRRKERKMGKRTRQTASELRQPEVLAAPHGEALEDDITKDKKGVRRERQDQVEARKPSEYEMERTSVEDIKASKRSKGACPSEEPVTNYDNPTKGTRIRKKRKKRNSVGKIY